MASIRPQTRAMIESLVGFDTTSAKSNLALIDFAQQYLESMGVRCRRTLDPEAGKANLFANLGPAAPGGVGPSGHSSSSAECRVGKEGGVKCSSRCAPDQEN